MPGELIPISLDIGPGSKEFWVSLKSGLGLLRKHTHKMREATQQPSSELARGHAFLRECCSLIFGTTIAISLCLVESN